MTKDRPLGFAGRLAHAFVDSKLTPLLVFFALGLGALAVLMTPREEEPQIKVPIIDVFAEAPGRSVVEVERQTGEWLLVVGYAGEVVTTSRTSFAFAPDRGVARSIIGRASYTVDPRPNGRGGGAARPDREGL